MMQSAGAKLTVTALLIAATGCPRFGSITLIIRLEGNLILGSITAPGYSTWDVVPEKLFTIDAAD
jgi:hypothetical protein